MSDVPQTTADFRSDTVTRPTSTMLTAMAEAEVGDDVLGHDPTTQALEEDAARLLGKDAALFMPSGTMCNLVALLTHTSPGDQILTEEWSHTACFEGGGAGVFAGVLTRTLGSTRGLMDAADVDRWMLPRSEHTPGTSLVCVEQTHNFHGGVVMPLDGLRAIRDVAHAKGARVHMDGARMFNAVAATQDSTAADHAACADTVSFCLSKGLCAPVGSLLCGDVEFIAQARFHRKRLGGGMRQSGVIAAAGRVALREMCARLVDDHALARHLATGIAAIDGYSVDPTLVDTNILFVETGDLVAAEVVAFAAAEDVLLYATGVHQIRFVTHHDVTDAHVDRLLGILERFVS